MEISTPAHLPRVGQIFLGEYKLYINFVGAVLHDNLTCLKGECYQS